jgi:hypothetical protein
MSEENPGFAYYSRYEHFAESEEGWSPRSAYDLMCPFCGAEEIVILEECEDLDLSCENASYMIGDKVQCWICKREFTVTQGCWKYREITSSTE